MATDESEFFRREYLDLMEQVPSAVFIIDPEKDRLVDVNTAACQLLGHERDALLQLVRPRDIHAHELDTFQAFAEQVQQDGEADTSRLSCMTGDGRVIPVHVSAVLTHDLLGRALIRAVVSERRDVGAARQ